MSSHRRSLVSQKGPRRIGTGFTLVELLVVMALMTLISGVLISLVKHSAALVSQGTQTIALNQKARFALDKISPYLVSVTNQGGNPAISSLSPGIIGKYTSIKFTTTEDYLAPGYDPINDSWVPGSVYYYEIYFDDTNNPTTYTMDNGTTLKLGRIILRRYDDASFDIGKLSNPTTYTPRPLAYNVNHFYCSMLTNNSLVVSVYTVGKRKGSAGQQVDMFEQAQGVINLPAPTYI